MSAPTNKLADFLREVAKGEENALQVSRQMMKGDDDKEHEVVVVAMQNRKLQPEAPDAPERAETPPRAHQFHNTVGLKAYLEAFGDENTVVFADVPNQRMQVVLDETADDGVEVLFMQPQVHPLFAPWVELLEAGFLPLADFALFILEHRRTVAGTGDQTRELALVFSQVRMSKHVEVQSGFGLTAVNGIMVEHNIEGQKKRQPVQIPESITLECPIYVGTEPRQITVDLTVTAAGDQVVVKASAADLLDAQVAAFEEMLAQLEGVKGQQVLGRASFGAWSYIR